VSRLTDLLAQARKTDPQLAADLEAEFRQLTQRSQFGLVFERHQPEAVELPGRPVRRGDTVRVLPPRGSLTIGDTRHWVVTDIERTPDGKQAHLTEADIDPEVREPATSTAAIEDLVVVARFEDPIYPGLVETGRVENGGPDKPFHTVINAENFHALEMLTYTHRHKVDCIYIDPPYNSGAKDWKYNNNYVGSDDGYRHSKWISFMERRLKVAEELLNPQNSVLIVTIDEKEYLRIGMLLEQTFPQARIQMITSVIGAKGSARSGEFSRNNEFIYFVMFGSAAPGKGLEPTIGRPVGAKDLDETQADQTSEQEVDWGRTKRNGKNGRRARAKSGFYPIFVDERTGALHSTGTPLASNEDWREVEAPDGTVAVWPIQAGGAEQSWGLGAQKISEYYAKGYLKIGKVFPNKQSQKAMIYHLTDGYVAAAESGDIKNIGTVENPRWVYVESKTERPFTVWHKVSHEAGWYGTRLLSSFLPSVDFDYAKSLYAVEDALRFFVGHKTDAVVLDFFSGSGTTAHAVMRLNKQDGGRRQCISVTNNEVSADEQKGLRKKGLRPGNPEWEQWGICDYITKPRITAAITGKTPAGDPIKGDYKFTDEFPMADGFEENAAFFTLTYEAPRQVRRNRAFARVAPMLWLKAGSRGRIISSLPERGWDVAQAYGVLEDMDHAPEFLAALEADPQVGMAFIVTDSEVAFQSVARQLPEHTMPVRLYESYLHNFQINRRA